MAKSASTEVLDGGLDVIALSTIQHVTSAEPANYAGIAAVSLASVTMAGADFTKAAGTPDGRQTTVAAKAGVSVATSGTATHIALATVTGTLLRVVTTCTSQALTSGNTVSIPAWVYTNRAPT